MGDAEQMLADVYNAARAEAAGQTDIGAMLAHEKFYEQCATVLGADVVDGIVLLAQYHEQEAELLRAPTLRIGTVTFSDLTSAGEPNGFAYFAPAGTEVQVITETPGKFLVQMIGAPFNYAWVPLADLAGANSDED